MGRGDPGAPSPCVGAASGRPGRTRSHLTGAGVPPRGACPAGARSISFSAEKETGLDSSSERIPFCSIPLAGDIRSIPFVLPLPTKAALLRGPLAGLRGIGTGKTAAFGFTHCLGTSPGRYGHPMAEQRKDGGSILRPPGCATLAAECGDGFFCGVELSLCKEVTPPARLGSRAPRTGAVQDALSTRP